MIRKLIYTLLPLLLALANNAIAQHCAPIVESYLSTIDIQRTKTGFDFEFQYSKTGGQRKTAYQAYLLVYADSNEDRIAKMTPQQAISEKLATVVNTQLAKRNDSGRYQIRWHLDTKAFVQKLLSEKLISMDRVEDVGGWKGYVDKIRLSVFIPFLEDEEYSVMEGLPDNKHECNYLGEAALLFETLQPKMDVRFGIVQAIKLDDGEHYIQLNGNRPGRN
jgi:hypothetical protein